MAANDPHSPFRLGKRRIDTGVPGRPLGPDSPRALSQALSQPASRFPLSRSPEAGTDTDPGAQPGRKGCREPDPVAPPHARRRRESRRPDGRPRPPRQVIRRPRGQRRLRTHSTAVPRSLAERSPGWADGASSGSFPIFLAAANGEVAPTKKSRRRGEKKAPERTYAVQKPLSRRTPPGWGRAPRWTSRPAMSQVPRERSLHTGAQSTDGSRGPPLLSPSPPSSGSLHLSSLLPVPGLPPPPLSFLEFS